MNAPVEPLVSVVLRTYEHASFIAQAIESVLIQEAPFGFELVIGEDCSPDGTRKAVERYAERHPDLIRAVLPEQNLGHGEILRRALEASRGSLIAYLDGDDYWTSTTKLKRQVGYLEAHPECGSCFHDVSLVYDEAGLPSGVTTPALAEASFSLEDVLKECFVGSPSMMFRREILDALPAWSWESAWIDWLFHIRAAERGPLGYISEPLAAYRVHRGGMFSSLDRISQVEEDLRFYKRLLPEMPEQAELIERCMQFRRCQLAIERLGVPFKACVVLVDPRHEMKPYFNGRHSRTLPRRDGREVTELEAIRRVAADLAPANPDYRGGGEALGEGGCFVVVPAETKEWLEGRRGLREYLAQEGREVWGDTAATIIELPLRADGAKLGERPTRRVEVTRAEQLSEELAGANFEAPTEGALLPAHAISTIGWVLGAEQPAEAVELSVDGTLFWRMPLDVTRVDIEKGFPDKEVRTPGFRSTINAQELASGTSAAVAAVLADGRRVEFAEMRFLDGAGTAS